MYINTKLKVSAKKAFEFFGSTTIPFDLNKNIKSFKLISEIDKDTNYTLNVGKGILVVSDREFVTAFHKSELPDGRFMTVFSDPVSLRYPIDKKMVRGEVNILSYLFTPIDDNNCMWEFISDGNPKGSIPTYVINKLVGRQLESLVSMKNYLENKY